MALKTVTLASPIVIADIIEMDLDELRIREVGGVITLFKTFLEPDSRGLLRPQTTSEPLADTMASGAFNAWLNQL